MGPVNDGWERQFNVTTIHNRLGEKAYEAFGVVGNCGPNRAIQSAHPGGAHVAMADGSVHFLADAIDLQVFYDLANRDDGHQITDGSF